MLFFSTDVSFIAAQAITRSQQRAGNGENSENGETDGADAMAALDRQIRAPAGFVAASSGPEGATKTNGEASAPAQNPDALDVDLDDD